MKHDKWLLPNSRLIIVVSFLALLVVFTVVSRPFTVVSHPLHEISPFISVCISAKLMALLTNNCSYFLVNVIWSGPRQSDLLKKGVYCCIGIQVTGKAVVRKEKDSEATLSEIPAGRWTLTFGKCKRSFFPCRPSKNSGSTTKGNYSGLGSWRFWGLLAVSLRSGQIVRIALGLAWYSRLWWCLSFPGCAGILQVAWPERYR